MESSTTPQGADETKEVLPRIKALLDISAKDYDPACMLLRELHDKLAQVDSDLAAQLQEAISLLETSGHPYHEALLLCAPQG